MMRINAFSAVFILTSSTTLVILAFFSTPIIAGCACVFNDTKNEYSCSNSGCTSLDVESAPKSVARMSFVNNSIRSIEQELLNFTELLSLDLSSNQISRIAEDAFSGNKKLENLVLIKNNLSNPKLDYLGPLKESLTYLDISGNKFATFEKEVFNDFKNLSRIDASNNDISSIDQVFWEIEKLLYLHLQGNDLEKLEPLHFYNLKNLLELDLGGNVLSAINGTPFKTCSQLLHLNISYNYLTIIRGEAFQGLEGLKRLDLTHNHLGAIDQSTFSNLINIEEIHLDYNAHIRDLGVDVFPKTLRKLSLGSTQIQNLTNGTFSNLPHLTELHLRRNLHLNLIDSNAFGGAESSIRTLGLGENDLETLDEALLNWSRVDYLDLSGNAWNCDCKMKWLFEVKIQNNPLSTMICHAPYAVAGKRASDLSADDFTCSFSLLASQGRYRAGLVFVTTAGLIMALGFAIILYKRRSKIRRWCRRSNDPQYTSLYDAKMTEEFASVEIAKGDRELKNWEERHGKNSETPPIAAV